MDKPEQTEEQINSPSEIREFKPDGLKQRLIGAIVLVSLAVIFLPMIFDEPHQEKKNIVIPIPDKPAEKIVTFEVPKPPKMQGGENQARSLEIIHEKEQQKKLEKQALPEKTHQLSEKVASSVSDMREVAVSDKSIPEKKAVPEKKSKPVPTETITENNVIPAAKMTADKSAASLPSNLNQSWVVQLGTFGNKVNALKLRDNARSQGYSTHTTDIEVNGKTLTRVFSGPFISKSEAAKVKALLDRKFKVSSIVVKFAG